MARLFSVLLFLLFGGALDAADPANEPSRGGKFDWARLKTDSPYWNQHAERDAHVIDLMRKQTSLNIGDAWHSAEVSRLEELCAYPFVFAQTIASLTDADGGNLAEYLRRGGFLLIDACVRVTVNPNAELYLAAQTKTLVRQFPNVRVVALAPDHEIYSAYFKLTKFPPQTRSGTNPSWARGSTEPLRGIFLEDRLVGVISLSGFQCGLVQNPNPADIVQMVTNICIYAMTR